MSRCLSQYTWNHLFYKKKSNKNTLCLYILSRTQEQLNKGLKKKYYWRVVESVGGPNLPLDKTTHIHANTPP